jgi:demethylmenaquinone methyltransferase / 2-methoxy-6-polyprenyl-1,4-benzoquinol methylase
MNVKDMFDKIAPTYDTVNRALSLGIDGLWRRQAVAALGDLAGARVLDLCAGTMDLTALVGRRFPTARITAADFSAEMLARGRAKLENVRAAVEEVVCDAQDLPFDDASFDAALCAFGVRNLDDPRAGLAELARVLRPGGQAAILEFFRPERGARRLFHDLYNKNVLPALGGLISGSADAYRYLAESMQSFLSRPELEDVAGAVGLAVMRSTDLFPAAASLIVLRKEESC